MLLGAVLLDAWHVATLPAGGGAALDPEYAALVGGAASTTGGLPSPAAVFAGAGELASRAFDGPNPGKLGIGLHLLISPEQDPIRRNHLIGLPAPENRKSRAAYLRSDGARPCSVGAEAAPGRVALGWATALAVGLPLGFPVGLSPRLNRAFDPYFQIRGPV